MFPWDDELAAIRSAVFGFEAWRPLQKEVINATLSRRDCFVVAPTGAGKSLLYQLPALLPAPHQTGITLVVAPLVSLIHDQVRPVWDYSSL